MGRVLAGMMLGVALVLAAPALLEAQRVVLAASGLAAAITFAGMVGLHLLTRPRIRFRRPDAPIARPPGDRTMVLAPRVRPGSAAAVR